VFVGVCRMCGVVSRSERGIFGATTNPPRPEFFCFMYTAMVHKNFRTQHCHLSVFEQECVVVFSIFIQVQIESYAYDLLLSSIECWKQRRT